LYKLQKLDKFQSK